MHDPNKPPKCPYCNMTFEAGSKTEDRMIYFYCKFCGKVISVTTNHSVDNSFDLRKIKEKLGITD